MTVVRARRLAAPALALAVLAVSSCTTSGSEGSADLTPAPSADTTASEPLAVPDDVPVAAGAPVGGIVTPPPPTTAPSAGAADPAGFTWSAREATAADLGSSWREGCPVGPASLRIVSLSYHDMGGAVRTGTLVIHEDIESATRRAFASLFAQRFPFESIRTVDEFGSDDDASMAANNTSAFNCRYAVTNSATKSWSNHAYGKAIDVNPRTNPYVLGGEVLPPNGAEFADRGVQHPGGLYRGGAALSAFTGNGFEWGGAWRNPDYQHVER